MTYAKTFLLRNFGFMNTGILAGELTPGADKNEAVRQIQEMMNLLQGLGRCLNEKDFLQYFENRVETIYDKFCKRWYNITKFLDNCLE